MSDNTTPARNSIPEDFARTKSDAVAGPFETEKVDALVFTQSSDAPETRAAAARIQQYRDVAPPPKRFTNVLPSSPTIEGPWIPLDTATVNTASQVEAPDGQRVSRVVSEVFWRGLVTVVPMALIFTLVVVLYRWFGFA